jgi:hypothetical protein
MSRMLFRSQDLSKIKAYCHRSWTKLLDDNSSVRDYIFSKEVRLGTYRFVIFVHQVHVSFMVFIVRRSPLRLVHWLLQEECYLIRTANHSMENVSRTS